MLFFSSHQVPEERMLIIIQGLQTNFPRGDIKYFVLHIGEKICIFSDSTQIGIRVQKNNGGK